VIGVGERGKSGAEVRLEINRRGIERPVDVRIDVAVDALMDAVAPSSTETQ
jgi:hypothetical protein